MIHTPGRRRVEASRRLRPERARARLWACALPLLVLVACGGTQPGPGPDAGSDSGTPPDTQLTRTPDALTAQTTATFAFTSDASDATFTCALDGAAASPCSSPATFTVADGAHTLEIAARTAAGADPTPAGFSWTVDTQPPDTTISAGPSGTVHAATTELSFTSSDSSATFVCSIDGAADFDCTSPASFDVAPGDHTFKVAAVDAVGNVDASPAALSWTYGTHLRVMAANLTSGNYQSYDDQDSQAQGCVKTSGYGTGEGSRIFQGLGPDVVAIQEFRYMGCDYTDSDSNVAQFVSDTFGASFDYYREPYTAAGDLPNGVVSRYPILASGSWADSVQTQPNRGFAWAQIDLPGSTDLYVISVHLLTSSETDRATELQLILSQIDSQFPAGAWVVLAGDFNTHSRTESGITDVSSEFVTASPWPVDQNGLDTTNSIRTYADDWVLASTSLDAYEVPVVIGSSTYPDGLVFDSRVYTPLSEVSPVLEGDSDANGMQHMGVVRDFWVP